MAPALLLAAALLAADPKGTPAVPPPARPPMVVEFAKAPLSDAKLPPGSEDRILLTALDVEKGRSYYVHYRKFRLPRKTRPRSIKRNQTLLVRLNEVRVKQADGSSRAFPRGWVSLHSGNPGVNGEVSGPPAEELLIFDAENVDPVSKPVIAELGPLAEGRPGSRPVVDGAVQASLVVVRGPTALAGPFKQDLLWWAFKGRASIKAGSTTLALKEGRVARIPAEFKGSVVLMPEGGEAQLLRVAIAPPAMPRPK